MGIRVKRNKLEYRFQVLGLQITHVTELEDTPENRIKVKRIEDHHRRKVELAKLRQFSKMASRFLRKEKVRESEQDSSIPPNLNL